MSPSESPAYLPPDGSITVDSIFGVSLYSSSDDFDSAIDKLKREGLCVLSGRGPATGVQRQHLLGRPDRRATAFLACNEVGQINEVALAFGGRSYRSTDEGQAIADELKTWLHRLLGDEAVRMDRVDALSSEGQLKTSEAIYAGAWSRHGEPMTHTHSALEFTEAANAMNSGCLQATIVKGVDGTTPIIMCMLALRRHTRAPA